MNPYDKLDHAERAWTMAETAAFLGYSVRHLYRLVRQNKIDGWSRVEGGHIMFCPCKLKVWLERRFNGNGKPPNRSGNAQEEPRKDSHEAST
jgi:hypothetical protein